MPPDDGDLAISGWNLMGGLDWAALPLIVEMMGITDVEQFVRQLTAIRDHQQEMSKHG